MSMRHARERRQPIPGATTSARTTPIAWAAAASGQMLGKPRRSAHSSPMRSASMTWSATSMSGSRIASTTIMMTRRRMVRPGSKAATATTIWTAAVPGTSLQTFCALRRATRAAPANGSTTLASGLAGRLLHLESLFLCFFVSLPLCLFVFLSLCPLGVWGEAQIFLEGIMNEHFKRAGPAVEAHYQFLLWLVPTVDRFPKSQKFVFGDRVLNLALDVLEGANEVVESRHFCCAAYVRYWHKADMPILSAFGGKADIGQRLLTNHGFVSTRPSLRHRPPAD